MTVSLERVLSILKVLVTIKYLPCAGPELIVYTVISSSTHKSAAISPFHRQDN
jgi:hypothetical protein